jgi:prophage maintenance system killer protein
MFCVLNGHQLDVPTEEAVTTMLAGAAGDLDKAELSHWLAVWVDREP